MPESHLVISFSKEQLTFIQVVIESQIADLSHDIELFSNIDSLSRVSSMICVRDFYIKLRDIIFRAYKCKLLSIDFTRSQADVIRVLLRKESASLLKQMLIFSDAAVLSSLKISYNMCCKIYNEFSNVFECAFHFIPERLEELKE